VCVPFGGLSGTAYRLKMCIFIPDNPPIRLQILAAFQIYAGLSCKGAPDPGVCPSQFIPFHPFLSGGMYWSAAAHFISGVPSERYLWGVPNDAGHYPYLPGKRKGLIAGSRLQLSHGVAGKIC
jgi:hypothetical protein